jgi:hypothetical protein
VSNLCTENQYNFHSWQRNCKVSSGMTVDLVEEVEQECRNCKRKRMVRVNHLNPYDFFVVSEEE